jgi:hypothetical protein
VQNLFNSLNAVDTSSIPLPEPTEQLLMRRGVVFEPLGGQATSHTPSNWNHEVNLKFNLFKGLPEETIASIREAAAAAATAAQATPVSPASSNSSTTSNPESPETPASVSTSLSHSMDVVVSTMSFTSDTLITASVPLYRTIDEIGDINVSHLLRIFGEATMRIYNGILCGQRVLFVGYSHAAADVAQMVCSAAALVTPLVTGICRRVFPYANLTDLSFLQCPGYVAGVTNPMFQENDSWWDLLCVLDLPNNTGTVKTVEEKRAEDEKTKPNRSHANVAALSGSNHNPVAAIANDDQPHYSMDNKFITTLLSAVSHKLTEDVVRQKFFDYTSAIMHQAQAIDLIYKNSLNAPPPPLSQPLPSVSSTSPAASSSSNASGTPAPRSVSPAIPAPSGTGTGSMHGKLTLVRDRKNNSANAAGLRKMLTANAQRAVLLSETTEFARAATHPWPGNNSINADNTGHHVDELDTEILRKHRVQYGIADNKAPLDGFALKASVFRFQHEVNVPTAEIAQMIVELFLSIAACGTGDDTVTSVNAQALIALFPESMYGIHPIAACLLSSSPVARYFATRIIQILNLYETTRPAVDSLNGQLKFAFERNATKIRDGHSLTDINAYFESPAATADAAATGLLNRELLIGAMAGVHYSYPIDGGVWAAAERLLLASPTSSGMGSPVARQPSREEGMDMTDYIP